MPDFSKQAMRAKSAEIIRDCIQVNLFKVAEAMLGGGLETEIKRLSQFIHAAMSLLERASWPLV